MENNKIDWYKYYLLVCEFQKNYGFEKCNQINMAKSIKDFRDSLIDEESKELFIGIRDNDIIEIADGLADLSYVILGSMWTFEYHVDYSKYYDDKLIELEKLILEYFTKEQFDNIFNEVHRSNMSKSCNTIDEVHSTMCQEKYKDIKYTYNKFNNKYNIIIDEDFPEKGLMKGKLLKSISYSPANLDFVNNLKI